MTNENEKRVETFMNVMIGLITKPDTRDSVDDRVMKMIRVLQLFNQEMPRMIEICGLDKWMPLTIAVANQVIQYEKDAFTSVSPALLTSFRTELDATKQYCRGIFHSYDLSTANLQMAGLVTRMKSLM